MSKASGTRLSVAGIAILLAVSLFTGTVPAAAQEPDPTPSPTPSGEVSEEQAEGQEPTPEPSDAPEPEPSAPSEEGSQTPSSGPESSTPEAAGSEGWSSGDTVAACQIYEAVRSQLRAVSDLNIPPCPADAVELPDPVKLINDLLELACGGGIGTSSASASDLGDCAETVLDLVNWTYRFVEDAIYNLCPELKCSNEVAETILDLVWWALEAVGGVVADVCPDAQACADAVINFVLDLWNTVFWTLCPSGSIDYCYSEYMEEADRRITTLINSVCSSPNSSGAQACIDMVNKIGNDVMWTVCPKSGPSPECLAELSDKALKLINDTLNLVCSSPSSSGAQACIDMVNKIGNDVMWTVCPKSGPSPECLAELSDKALKLINDTLNLVCSSPTSSGAQACIDMVLKLWDDIYRTICPSGSIDYCYTEYLDQIREIIADFCGSSNEIQCVSNILDQIDGILYTACGLGAMIPPGELLATDGLPPGVDRCVGVVLGAIEIVMKTACDSIDPVTCVNNLLTQVDNLVRDLCTSLQGEPANVGGTVGDLPSGVVTCIDKVVGIVQEIMIEICNSPSPSTCVNNLLTQVDELVRDVCGMIPVDSGGNVSGEVPPGVAACVVKVIGTVHLVMTTVCRSANAETCAENLIQDIDELLSGTCGSIPIIWEVAFGFDSSSSESPEECIARVLSAVEATLLHLCGSNSVEGCATKVMSEVQKLLIIPQVSLPSAACDVVKDVCDELDEWMSVPVSIYDGTALVLPLELLPPTEDEAIVLTDRGFVALDHPGSGQLSEETVVEEDNDSPVEDVEPPAVIGDDDREPVNDTTIKPYRMIVKIRSSLGGGGCTGWMFGADTVITAAHCLYSRNKEAARNIRVLPGLDGWYRPFGQCEATNAYVARGWYHDPDRRWDWGGIKLNCKVGKQTGWFGAFWQDGDRTGEASWLSGYPRKTPDGSSNTQWWHKDSIRDTHRYLLWYENDTTSGQSGSPVWRPAFVGDQFCRYCSMAIHGGSGSNGGWWHVRNRGRRINEPVYNGMVRIRRSG